MCLSPPRHPSPPEMVLNQPLSPHPLRCPFCSNEETQVKDSRPTEDGTAIRRRRYCPD